MAGDITAFARDLMAAHKAPRQARFRDALPRIRKSDRRMLQAKAARRMS